MSTSIATGMMNTPLPNLAGRSAVKKDPGSDPPPPDFSDSDTSSEGAFSPHGASDSDSSDIQWIKPSTVKPTLDLATVPVWDHNISTRDNAQAIKISLGSAGYLDTTKGKGTHQEQLILLAALRHATANYPMALAIVGSIIMDSKKCGYAAWTALFTELQGSAIEERMRLEEEITAGQLPNEPVQVYVRRCRNLWHLLRKAHGQWTFEYVAINYLIPGLHPAYDHIVDATISATNVNKRLATTIITTNVAAFKLADPGPFSGYTIYNPVAGRTTSPLPMPAFQFSNADYLMDEFQPSGQQEGPHAPPPRLPSAALASAHEGPPSPHHNEQHPPHRQEGDATALSAPHNIKHAQLPSHYVDLSDYHPTLVASAIAAVVRPHSARLTALALPAPTVRVSTAPRTYEEDICSTRPDDWKTSMNHEINSITTMALFVWVNVPGLRRNNESAVIQQMAWSFTAQHKDGNIIKREAGVIVRGNLLTTGETYNDAKTYAPVVHFVALRTTIAITVQLTWELYQFDVRCVFLNADRNADTYDYLSPGCGRKDRVGTPLRHSTICGRHPRHGFCALLPFYVTSTSSAPHRTA
eukprot:jgi/Tetstr1/429721/TSEL_019614.t1